MFVHSYFSLICTSWNPCDLSGCVKRGRIVWVKPSFKFEHCWQKDSALQVCLLLLNIGLVFFLNRYRRESESVFKEWANFYMLELPSLALLLVFKIITKLSFLSCLYQYFSILIVLKCADSQNSPACWGWEGWGILVYIVITKAFSKKQKTKPTAYSHHFKNHFVFLFCSPLDQCLKRREMNMILYIVQLLCDDYPFWNCREL